uniref:Retrovirus-related Pol polyprotein from transposon TNT 1-94 n=1 Tax=Tanacetum cinerariifolium TaxID=118510 RepID=A0A6L2JH70_TANCI|nr:hypothetical protein [Tanacetum cinerariifolium]
MVITLKWIYKVKIDELGGILKNTARLVACGYRQEEGIDFEESQDFSKVLVDPTLFICRNGNDLLLKYGFKTCDLVDTLTMEKSKLDEDKEGKAIDPSRYRDANHTGFQDTRGSTSGSLQFLGDKLISWSSKRQRVLTMDMTIDQQVALGEALVPYASRLRIRKINFHIKSNISSKESTLQLVYDVLDEEDDDVDEGSDDQDDNDAQDDNDDQDDDAQDDDDDDHDERDNDDDQDESNDDDQDFDKGEEFIHPRKEGQDEEDDEDELYRDVNINLEGSVIQIADVHTTQEFKDTHVTLTLFAGAVSSILEIVQSYMDQRMNEAVKIKMKNPPLDKTEGLKGEKKERSQSQQTLQRIKRPGQLAGQHKGPSLNKRLQASLYQQRSQCRLLKIWKSPHIKSLKQISELAKKADTRSSFNDLMTTPVDFSVFLMNLLKVDTLTPELLAGITYELMKGSCKSFVELEFFLEEVYKETIDQLDWNNLKGQQYPHNRLKPLPLIPNSRGRRVIPFDHFIKNDLEYLHGGAFSRKESARDVYSKHKIIAVTELQIVKWHNYKHLDWITMRRDDDKLYKFKEGNFKRLHIQDIKDMLLLLNVHKKHRNPKAYGRPSTWCRKLPEEAQPHKAKYIPFRSKPQGSYTAYSNPRGFIYQNKDKQNRLMWIDELHKFSDGTLNDVGTALDDCLKAKDKKDHEKSGKVYWWETVRGRL